MGASRQVERLWGLLRGEGSPLALNKISLRFADGAIEERFLREHLVRSLPIIRIAMLSAAILYALFGILDVYILPGSLTAVWAIRYLGVCPILAGIYLFTFSPHFLRFAQVALAIGMVASGLGIIGMVAAGDPPGAYWYYAGLIMVVIYASSLIRLHYSYACAISLGLLIAYEIVATSINPVPFDILINNNFFLVMSVAVGTFSGYGVEFYVRRAFASNYLLAEEKARSEALLAKAQEANRAKTEFLANVSHELRTPLNAIIGFSEMIKLQMFGPLGSERYRSYMGDIYTSAKHLLSIINDILDLSKAEAGKLTLSDEAVDLCDVVDASLRMFRDTAAQQGVRLSFAVPVLRPRLTADARLVSQVVINLVSNAIKFTQPGGAVTIAVETEPDGSCALRVEDTGIGMAREHVAKVVELFVQVESAYSRAHAGTGLGLPLVKKIMELHGGALEIESTLGVGTRVTARFPPVRVLGLGTKAPRRMDAVA